MITDIDWNKYFQDLTNKANIDLLNANYNIDIVIDYKVNLDGSWYRRYKSGWLEQGGFFKATGKIDGSQAPTTLTLPIPFKEAEKYTVLVSSSVGKSGWQYSNGAYTATKNTTNIIFAVPNGEGQVNINWYACGQGA